MPNGYEIETHHLKTLEDGTEIWVLRYKEFFTEEKYNRAVEPSKKAFKNLTHPHKFDDENHTFSYEVTGPRAQILSVLAGEFLGISPVGTMCFKDLLASVSAKLISNGKMTTLLGTKPPKEKRITQ